jgi:hypothetical protein
MSSKKHSDTVDLNVPYEQNEIQLKGIIGFGIGLFLLIVITFGLMWALLGTLKDYWKETDKNPMAMSDRERLPPEPRLQLAPGFGVDSQQGRVNMELAPPAAEYLELRKQWNDLLKHGRKDEKTGTMSVMPIDMAKERFLSQNAKSKTGAAAQEVFDASRSYVTDQSSGRMASEKRR